MQQLRIYCFFVTAWHGVRRVDFRVIVLYSGPFSMLAHALEERVNLTD